MFVIGTAGHVDHGKTALVRALTGIDTDRLPDEKRRGISIDLGFAHLDLPGDRRVAFVDVPGHERFIKNMVAGVQGVDACLLVVAADEGVMPQTREHLDILRLLGVDRGFVVLTKRDLVDDDWLALVRDDVRRALDGSGLAAAPMLAASSLTGEGLDDVRRALADLFGGTRPRPSAGPVRLPIDRSFTVAGFGTVVTGTLISGTMRPGDRVEILPAGREARVRGLQSHGAARDEAAAGQRVAVNLAGVDWRDIRRGMTLSTPGAFHPERRIAARVRVLSGAAPVADGARLRFHAGTQETPARIVLLEAWQVAPDAAVQPGAAVADAAVQPDAAVPNGAAPYAAVQPGASALVRLHLARPVVVAPGDRFLLRSLSPVATVGGGTVLDLGRRYRKRSAEDLARLAAIEARRPADLLLVALDEGPLVPARWARENSWPEHDVRAAVEEWIDSGAARWLFGGEAAVSADRWRKWVEDAAAQAAGYLLEYPLRRGWPREDARIRLFPSVEAQLGQRLLEELAQAGAIELAGDAVRPPAARVPEVPPAVRTVVSEVAQLYQEAGLQPPDLPAVAARTVPAARAAEVVRHLAETGVLVHVQDELYFAGTVVEAAKDRLRRELAGGRAVSMAEFRDILGTTRKYAVPLAEYLDRVRFTRREGDTRKLAPGATRDAPGPAG